MQRHALCFLTPLNALMTYVATEKDDFHPVIDSNQNVLMLHAGYLSAEYSIVAGLYC